MELYNELYDHIATSYENREDKNQPLQAHIDDVFLASFGGYAAFRKSLSKIRYAYQEAFYKSVWQNVNKQLYPTWLLAVLIIATALSMLVNNASLILDIWVLAMIIPFAGAQIMVWKFRIQCQKLKLPYNRSFVNKEIRLFSLLLAGLISGFPDITSRIIYGQKFSLLAFLSDKPGFVFLVTLIILTYSTICVMLLLKKFNWKPITV
jgi:hypothetical protein